MISNEAMDAAHKAWREQAALGGSIFEYNLRAALEAAAPHMLADLLDKLDAVHALVYDNTLAGGCVMHVIDPARIRAALGDYPWNGNQKAGDS